MKRLITISALAFLLGVFRLQSQSLTLTPSVPEIIIYDLSNVPVSVSSFSVFVSKPSGNNLSPGTPLTVTLYDETLGEFITGGQFVFSCIENCGNVQGHVLILTLMDTGRKALNVLVTTAENFGGQ